ncbi:MAG: hypothetical protein H7144_13495 [Burkholderiales bacterium]|nr:hypothetical protein [Phycisphaerae bacterium]
MVKIATVIVLTYLATHLQVAALTQPATLPTTAPTTRPAATHDPAPTPGDALQRWWQAMAIGDEKAFSRRVVFRSATGYCNIYARWVFASARLHEAAMKHKLKRERGVRGAKWSPDVSLSPGLAPAPPSERSAPHVLDEIRKIEWTIAGDMATPMNSPFSSSEHGKVTAERVDGGWVIALSDPDDKANATELNRFVQEFTAITDAIETAIDRVNAGEFLSVRQVNDFLQDAFEKVKVERKQG